MAENWAALRAADQRIAQFNRTWKKYTCNSTNSYHVKTVVSSGTITVRDSQLANGRLKPSRIATGTSVEANNMYVRLSGTTSNGVPGGSLSSLFPCWILNGGTAYYCYREQFVASYRADEVDDEYGMWDLYYSKMAWSESTPTYSQGAYCGEVSAAPSTYPDNGRASDGYWYVLQP